MEHLTAGIAGDELIRRRAAGLCVACGWALVFAVSASGDQPWLCARCTEKVPARPRFDGRKHRADGLRNLERLEKG